MPHPVIHFEIMAKNAAALTEFYKEAFDWQIGASETGGVAVDGGSLPYFVARPYGNDDPERGINGGIGEVPPGYDGHVTFYIHVNDCAEALKKIESLGGTTMLPPQKLPGLTIAQFKDPNGNVIGLVDPEM